MSSPTIDTTLPESSSPAFDHFRDEGRGSRQVTLYLHVELDQPELKDLLRTCNSQLGNDEDDQDSVALAPNYRQYDQPLRAAYDIHVNEIASAGVFDSIYFVAVIDRDWKTTGVILVTLDSEDDEETCNVDQMRVQAEHAGLYLINMQIANVDWVDYKENEYLEFGDDDEDEDAENDDKKDDDDDDDNDDDDDAPWPEDNYGQVDDEYYSDGASSKQTNIGYWIGLYAIHGIEYETVMRELDNSPIDRPSSELEVRPEGRVPNDQMQAIAEASRLHPMRCHQNPLLCRDMFLIADTQEYHKRGMLLVRLEWDQNVDDQSMAQLAAKGSQAKTDTRRLPTSSHETTTLLNMIAKGYVLWKPTHSTFICYNEFTRDPSKLMRLFDGVTKGRTTGAEKVIEGSCINRVYEREERDEGKSKWEQTLLRHPLQVYRERFCWTLQRQYLIYTETEVKAKGDLVTIAKMEWNGDAEGLTLEELAGEVDVPGVFDVKTMRCAIGEAYDTLVALAEGRKEWSS